MSKRDKLLKKLRNNPQNVKFETIQKLLLSFGFKERQPKGGSSHYTELVSPIVDKLKKDYVVKIDESFLQPGDSVKDTIMENIHKTDFTLLFLSQKAIDSAWVAKQIYETIKEELRTKTVKLIPCLLEKIEIPEVLRKANITERLYIDFSKDYKKGIDSLKERIKKGKRSIFENVNFISIKIPVDKLDIYFTGDFIVWRRYEEYKHVEAMNSYLLYGFEKKNWYQWKHFCLCDPQDVNERAGEITHYGFKETGSSRDDLGYKNRVWFLLEHAKYPWENNGGNINNTFRSGDSL